MRMAIKLALVLALAYVTIVVLFFVLKIIAIVAVIAVIGFVVLFFVNLIRRVIAEPAAVPSQLAR